MTGTPLLISRVYYLGDYVFDGPPEEAPQRWVICILQKRPDGKYNILSQKSHYLHNGNEWIGASWDDIEDYLLDRREEKIIVVRGGLVGTEEYWKTYRRAKEDRDKDILG